MAKNCKQGIFLHYSKPQKSSEGRGSRHKITLSVTLRQQFVNFRHKIRQTRLKSKVLRYFFYFSANSHVICIKYWTLGGPRRSATKFPGAARGSPRAQASRAPPYRDRKLRRATTRTPRRRSKGLGGLIFKSPFIWQSYRLVGRTTAA